MGTSRTRRHRSSGAANHFRDTAALFFALVLPTVVTLAYFVWLAGASSGIQKTAYSIGKCIQFAFPLIWVKFVLRRRFFGPWPTRHAWGPNLAFGTLVASTMVLLYQLVLEQTGFLSAASEEVRSKIADLGLNSPGKYISLGVFYAAVHSLLEEYYWRWFVFGQLREHLGFRSSVLISSAGFMAHHVVLLSVYFGCFSPTTYVLSLAVAMGGIIWAWIYEYSGSLLGPWLSHALVDAGIFIIGYQMSRF